jgi:hypothetical protein
MRSREEVLTEFGLLQHGDQVREDHGDGVSSLFAPSSTVLAMADRIRSLEATPARDADGIQLPQAARVTEEMVERAAIALYLDDLVAGPHWEEAAPRTRKEFRAYAKIALTAALTGGTPDAA